MPMENKGSMNAPNVRAGISGIGSAE